MYNFYTINSKVFNNDLDIYIEIILNDIFSKMPKETIKNIVKYMDLNYQWIEIRKFYRLNNSPLTLDFNLENYKNICKKYLSNLTIIFNDLFSYYILDTLLYRSSQSMILFDLFSL